MLHNGAHPTGGRQVCQHPPAASTPSAGEDIQRERPVQQPRPMCVQRRLARSAGVSPAGVTARSPVAWIAGRREIDDLKPLDKAVLGTESESPGRNASEPGGNPESAAPEAEPLLGGRRQHGSDATG